MQTTTYGQPPAVANWARWTGRGLTTVAALFLLMDGVVKLLSLPPVLEANTQLGIPVEYVFAIGLLELAVLAVYLVPQTAFLGALLLTGYLGGAVAINLRAEAGTFPVVFPFLMGLLVWGGLYLRDSRLRALLPLRS